LELNQLRKMLLKSIWFCDFFVGRFFGGGWTGEWSANPNTKRYKSFRHTKIPHTYFFWRDYHIDFAYGSPFTCHQRQILLS